MIEDRRYGRGPVAIEEFPIPESSDLERQLISDVVANPETMPDVLLMVTPEVFSGEERRKIWNRIIDMFNAGEDIDLVSVYAKVGRAYSQEVMSSKTEPGTPMSVISHAKLLCDAAARRRAYFSAIELLKSSTTPGNTEEDMLAETQRVTDAVRGTYWAANGQALIEDVVNLIADEAQEQERLAREGKSLRVTTGFKNLDWLTYRGFGPGNLVILAARPSVGKTAVMLQMARAAAEAGTPVQIFSLEMTKQELGKRMLFSSGLVSPAQLASGQVDWGNFERAAAMISSLPIEINDSSRDCSDIVSRILISRQRGRCGIAFIDYLGLMVDKYDYRVSLTQALGAKTAALKAAAKTAGIPIVLLCQLNRDSAKDNRAPMLFDLRDSGSIEQDADIVLMLEQAQSQATADSPMDVNMWVRKNRQFKKDVCIVIRPNSTYSEFVELQTE